MRNFSFIDSEIGGKKTIRDLGAVRNDGAELHTDDVSKFKNFIRKSDYIVGHNILRHDIQYIKDYLPRKCEIIDTLFVSPLLFPEKPYHKLVKDDKLSYDDPNNPDNDSKKCRDLYFDETSKFDTLPKELKTIFGSLLCNAPEFSGFFHSVGWPKKVKVDVYSLKKTIQGFFSEKICINADLGEIIENHPVELAYALAIIAIKDYHSITPGWVLSTYPEVENVIRELRDSNCGQEECSYCRSTFDSRAKLKQFFNYDDFRKFDGEDLQKTAVDLALKKKSLLAVFPTGGGKSLTFQLPALIEGEATRSLTVVISPLQSLMKDQVDNLENKGIFSAVTINGLLDPLTRSKAIQKVRDGSASLLYIAPESLRSKTIEKLLLSRHIARFVIDEAHCFSAWGQDFRVDYLFIPEYIKKLQEAKKDGRQIPISCFTATAKPKVVSDIEAYFLEHLGVTFEKVVSRSARKNLTYQILKCEDGKEKYEQLRTIIQSHPCPTIVYVAYTRETTELAKRLSDDNIPALPFNGSMESEEKIANQNAFKNDECQVIVATSAFGMGVDKNNVGTVIHYDISGSLEDYVQEAGRAGRNESIQADCYILFNENDLDKQFLLLNQSKLTINEIQQIWQAIKSMTTKNKFSVSASALEIARRAGWINDSYDIETKVKSALNALEQAGYIERNMNSPRVFATSVNARSFVEAKEKIENSGIFITDTEKTNAKRVIQKIIGEKSRLESDAESRVDYLADDLGLSRKDTERAIQQLRQLGILADSQELFAYIKKAEEGKTDNIITRFRDLERYMVDHLDEHSGVGTDLKEFNDHAIRDGVKKSTIKNIKTILLYWAYQKDIVFKKRDENFRGDIPTIEHKLSIEEFKRKSERRLALSDRIYRIIFDKATNSEKEEEQVNFSLLGLMETLNSSNLLTSDACTLDEVRDAVFYLSRIGALHLEGGFLVLYNALNIVRKEKDNHIQYKKEDYKDLAQFYQSKTQQIHFIGRFANMMVDDYRGALTYISDYFNLEYSAFIKKYFKGKGETGEINRNITHKKYEKIFGNLSPIQKEIIDDDQSQCISVIAGPGSGKTRVLVHKLASLLMLEDVKSEQLLMLTFSRSAAREFKSRLVELVGSAANYVDIKTFHSYCFDLLGKLGNEEEFGAVVRAAVEAINNGEVEEEKIAKTVLVIDEAQDIDSDEYALIQALIKRNTDPGKKEPRIKIIAVGDDDQNIYEFRGSDSKYLAQLISDYGATKYEMVDNYRSTTKIIDLANSFAHTIKTRIKTKDIEPVTQEEGDVLITEHTCEDLEEPVCNDFLNRNLQGRSAILTATNESALKVVGILNKRGVKAKLIQADDAVKLNNLAEFRYFLKLIFRSQEPVVANEIWEQSKEALRKDYSSSAILSKVLNVISSFEKETGGVKYRNDFLSYIQESSFNDFENFDDCRVVVSTIHKAKGHEFDNVFMLLNSAFYNRDEEKRKVYVGLTRAKKNLYVHVYGSGLNTIARKAKVPYLIDSKTYEEPDEMMIQLSYHDVALSFFGQWGEDAEEAERIFKGKKKAILAMRSGEKLVPGDGCLFDLRGKCRVRYSKDFNENTLKPLLEKGYKVVDASIRYIVAWKEAEALDKKECAVIFPDIFLRKVEEVPNDGSKTPSEQEVESKTESGLESTLQSVVEIVSYSRDHRPKKVPEAIDEETKNKLTKSHLYSTLKRYRLLKAKEANLPSYCIFTDEALLQVAYKKPRTQEELLSCYGFGKRTVDAYGEEILKIIKSATS